MGPDGAGMTTRATQLRNAIALAINPATGTLWAGHRPAARVPRAVAESIERLRAELKPERGTVNWKRVHARRAAALKRIQAVERYARGRGCRRAELMGYFGERLDRCAGCERCEGRPPVLARLWRRVTG